MKEHHYTIQMKWTGNTGTGTSSYSSYKRNHEIITSGKPPIPGSSDPAFRGDASRYNPEELLVASLSACHMLWYLHLCAVAGIVVTQYSDQAAGIMIEGAGGGGRFSEVVLHPDVVVKPGADQSRCLALHEEAHGLCFIANSVNFPVRCEPKLRVEGES